MDTLRRALLKSVGMAGTLTASVAAGLLRPSELLAAEWNKGAFEAKTLADALAKFGAPSAAESKDIIIKAPDIAENGAVVPIEITSKSPGTQSIAIFAEKNPQPLVGSFDFSNGTVGYVATRIKMSQTSNIKVVVNAGGKYYSAAKEVKVTIGGCGG